MLKRKMKKTKVGGRGEDEEHGTRLCFYSCTLKKQQLQNFLLWLFYLDTLGRIHLTSPRSVESRRKDFHLWNGSSSLCPPLPEIGSGGGQENRQNNVQGGLFHLANCFKERTPQIHGR